MARQRKTVKNLKSTTEIETFLTQQKKLLEQVKELNDLISNIKSTNLQEVKDNQQKLKQFKENPENEWMIDYFEKEIEFTEKTLVPFETKIECIMMVKKTITMLLL